MKNILALQVRKIGEENSNTVDARSLHQFLESKQNFADWIKNRLNQYGFSKDIDYCTEDVSMPSKQQGKIEYHLTIDTAKELSMIERTPKGREARKYFIDCEKRFKSVKAMAEKGDIVARKVEYSENDLKPIAPQVSAALEIAKAFGLEGNQAILTANKAVKKLTGVDCLELMDLKALPAPEQQLEYNSTDFGRLYAGGIGANVVNCMMELLGVFRSFRDSKNNLKWEITDEGKKYALYKDVEKKTGGVPIKQIFIKDCAKDLISSEILVKAAIRSKEHRIVLSRCKKVEAV